MITTVIDWHDAVAKAKIVPLFCRQYLRNKNEKLGVIV